MSSNIKYYCTGTHVFRVNGGFVSKRALDIRTPIHTLDIRTPDSIVYEKSIEHEKSIKLEIDNEITFEFSGREYNGVFRGYAGKGRTACMVRSHDAVVHNSKVSFPPDTVLVVALDSIKLGTSLKSNNPNTAFKSRAKEVEKIA